MCKLMVGITTIPGNSDFQTYIRAQEPDLMDQKDGIAGVVITKDNEVRIFRSLLDYGAVLDCVYKLLPTAKLVALHTRTSTSGGTNADNVHFFESDGWILAHNGFVPEYHTYAKDKWYHEGQNSFWNRKKKESGFVSSEPKIEEGDEGLIEEDPRGDCAGCYTAKTGACRKHKDIVPIDVGKDKEHAKGVIVKCDSFQFLDALKKPPTLDSINELIDKSRFTGVAILIEKATGKTFFLIKKVIKAQIGEGFGLFYSYAPEKEVDFVSWEYPFGIPVKKATKVRLELPIRSVPEGVFEIVIP